MATTATRDRPGPHPENQRKRMELRGPRRSLTGVLAIVAVLAIAGGTALLTSVDGRILRQPLDLVGVSTSLSFHTIGLLLAVVIGGTQALSALLLLAHHVRARLAALVAALLAIAWSLVQILVLDGVTWFQLALLAVGAFEAALVAGCTPRADGNKKKMRGRP